MGEGYGDGGAAATEQGEADKEHGAVGHCDGFFIGGGDEGFKGVEMGVGEEVGEGGGGLSFDEEGTVVVAVDGGGRVVEASGERVEKGESLGEGGLKELGVGGELRMRMRIVEEEGDVAMDGR